MLNEAFKCYGIAVQTYLSAELLCQQNYIFTQYCLCASMIINILHFVFWSLVCCLYNLHSCDFRARHCQGWF